MADVIRRKHPAPSTEQSYCAWLKRYCDYVAQFPSHLPSESKFECFLTAQAKNGVSTSTQNQALNAIAFFYKEVRRG
jgi:site-specific recombinase XerD